MEKEKKVKIKQVIKIIVQICIPLIMIFVLEIFFKLLNIEDESLKIPFGPIILSFLIGGSLYAILLACLKKNFITVTVFSIMEMGLIIINQFKIIYTGEPVLLSDFNFLGNSGDIAGLISGSMVLKCVPYFVGMGLILIVLVIISKIMNNELKSYKVRICIFSLGVCILILLFFPNQNLQNMYSKVFLGTDKYTDYGTYTTNLQYFKKYNLILGIYSVAINNRSIKPDNYDENEINKELENAKNEISSNTYGKPNIIVVFSEAFWDIDKLDEITFDTSVTSNFNKLKSEGQLVELLSCSYGGASENVAWELLTGGSLNYYTRGYIPIMSLYRKKNSDKMPSLIKELKNNGYKSEIIFGKDYYNSKNALLKMGFDTYTELEQTRENEKGYFISDEYVMDEVIKRLDEKDDEPIFCMVETIQNHMPYCTGKYENYDVNVEKSDFNELVNVALREYAQGIYDADKQLGRLYEYIQKQDEPTMIIFLGDHLPYLYTIDGGNAKDSIKYFNEQSDLENIYRTYNTEALILTNYETEKNIPTYLSNDLLLTYIANNMDIELSDYYKWLYTTKEVYPATNFLISVDKDGNKYYNVDITDEMKKVDNLKKCMQYHFFGK